MPVGGSSFKKVHLQWVFPCSTLKKKKTKEPTESFDRFDRLDMITQ